MKTIYYILTFILGLSISALTQNSLDLTGRWKWEFFIMDDKKTQVDWEDYLVLHQDGSFKKECKYRAEELHVCDSGKWQLNAKRILHLDPDKSANGGFQHAINYHIYKFKGDTLVINSKEGPKDIFIYYIKQK